MFSILIKVLCQGFSATQRLRCEGSCMLNLNRLAASAGRGTENRQILVLRGKMEVETWAGLALV